jgi:hypothetical protein
MSDKQPRGGDISAIVTAVQRAGYDLTNERELGFGIVALQTAEMLYFERLDAMRGRPGAQRLATGRNQPCPCGSGKKYKLCCLTREQSSTTEAPKSPEEEPALIPRLRDTGAMRRDTGFLVNVLETDPVLREIRFDRTRCIQFLDSSTSTAEGGEELSEQIDELAQRYFLEVEDGKLPGDLFNKLREAATRVSGTDELRSLAMGMILATTAETRDGTPDPLVGVLFRLSIGELLRGHSTFDEIVDRLGGQEAVAHRVMTSDLTLNQEIEDLASSLGPEDRRDLETFFFENLRSIEKSIDEGRFPVYLSFASVLPLLADLTRFSSRKPTSSELEAIVLRALDGMEEEDLRLYGQLLREWLDEDDGEDQEATSQVRMVSYLVGRRALMPLDWPLMKATLRHGVNAVLPGEEELVAEIRENALEPAALERYATFLDSMGYGALARRTRRLGSGGEP